MKIHISPLKLIKLASILIFSYFPSVSNSQSVDWWVTSGDKSRLFQKQASINLSATSVGVTKFIINPSNQFQTIDGFGYTLTEGSCEAIKSLSGDAQNKLLDDIFNPVSGLGVSVIRLGIGATDLSSYSYSYNESSNDVAMNNFNLAGPDKDNVIPILTKIMAINPKIKIIATPWSAPKWMKTNNSWSGGSLQTQYQDAYAKYFVKYIQSMKNLGFDIWAITPQNEPLNGSNEPSMEMSSSQQLDFINNNLGPAFKNAGITTKIIGYDHNCSNTAYPIEVCKSPYVDGSAFHKYDEAELTAMAVVHDATKKNVYFTEQSLDANKLVFSTDLPWHGQFIEFGGVNNWAKVVLEWNLASYSNYTPHTGGGCNNCMGAISINGSDVTMNLPYYTIGHMSKVIKPGAIRFDVVGGGLYIAAFKNTDGTIGIATMNKNSETTVSIKYGNRYLNATVPGNSFASFIWTEPSSSIVLSTPQLNINADVNTPLNIPVTVSGGTVSKITYVANFVSIGTATTAPYSINWTPTKAGQYSVLVSAYDANGNYVSSITINVNVASYQPIPGTIQAEAYDNLSGNLHSETCSDAGGGLDMGYLSAGDYLEYNVNVANTGIYTFNYRVAGTSDADFSLLLDGTSVGTFSVTNTGGFQTWKTIANPVQLTAGKHTLRLKINTAGWNLNYIKFDILTGVFDNENYLPQISVYPNPTQKEVYIKGDFNAGDHVRVDLLTPVGEVLQSENLVNTGSGNGMGVNMKELPAGIYFLKIYAGEKVCFRKIIKN